MTLFVEIKQIKNEFYEVDFICIALLGEIP